MKLAALLLLFALPAAASDTYLGTIVSSGASTTNASTATPFTLLAGSCYAIQCDQNVNLSFGAAGTSPVATTAQSRMEFLAQQPIIYAILVSASSLVWAIIPVTAGTANCQVFTVPMQQYGVCQ